MSDPAPPPVACLADPTPVRGAAIRRVLAVLAAAGAQGRLVGGCVRNALLGRPASDLDVATPLVPHAVMVAAERAGLGVIPTGLKHGTVTILAETAEGRREPVEVTTLRRDVASDGRHAEIVFTTDWAEDAGRRDFTMNALYLDAGGQLFDYFGGLADALAGRVLFVGDPARRIAEDHLRILRFFRFHAGYGQGGLDPAGLAACAAGAAFIPHLSRERVRDELLKLLAFARPVPCWEAMLAVGVMAQAVPGATDTRRLARLIAAEAAAGLSGDPIRRLRAVLAFDDPVMLADAARDLRLSNIERARMAALGHRPSVVAALLAGAFDRALYHAGVAETLDEAVWLASEAGWPASRLAALRATARGWSRPRLPVNGADLRALGLGEGPQLGLVLARLEVAWIESGFALGRESLLAAAVAGSAG